MAKNRQPLATKRRPLAAGWPRSPGLRRGFTLIEILVVIVIIMVVLGLGASVISVMMDRAMGADTLARQKVILSAIAAYRDVAGEYPPDSDAGLPADTDDRYVSGHVLYSYLSGLHDANLDGEVDEPDGNRSGAPEVKAAMAILRKLGDIFGKAVQGAKTYQTIEDNFGAGMKYFRSAALGGRPRIVSAGPDGEFGDPDVPEEAEKAEDNIRSDRP